MVTDRNDLDEQLFETFAGGRVLLAPNVPAMATSGDDLRERLDRQAGGVVFTTIQKFQEEHGLVSDRPNVVVMADEAHRSQYGFVDGKARWMREVLPNATFVGFTGTPIAKEDANTRAVFGDYADTYGVRQAVQDRATVPILYEAKVIPLVKDEAGTAEAEKMIAEVAGADDRGEEADAGVQVRLEDLLGAPQRIEELAAFVVKHWEERHAAMEGKAMVVTASREIAMNLHDAVVALRPEWHADDDDAGELKVVMTEGVPPQRRGEEDAAYRRRVDPVRDRLAEHGRTKARRKKLAERFKDAADDFRVAIVCDMWLTGFDVPSAHTMYLDKPLSGHNLMQAIARVNRVHGDKPGGVVVDTINLTDALADAMATYAAATEEDETPIANVQDQAVPAMQEAYEKLQGFFHGFDYASLLDAPPERLLNGYREAADFVLDLRNDNDSSADADGDGENPRWMRYRTLVKALSVAFALAVPRPETQAIASELSFFQKLAAAISKTLADDAPAPSGSISEVNAAVRQVLGGAVAAGEAIDLFGVAGLEESRVELLSDEFLERVAAMKQKNVALEALRRLLNKQIRTTERKNVVQSRRFREALEDAMIRYTNKQITTAEMIAHLLDLAGKMREERARGRAEGLGDDEIAFYDALAENGSAKEVMKSDDLRLMARKLTEMVRNLPKLDWSDRESVRLSSAVMSRGCWPVMATRRTCQRAQPILY